MFFREIFSECIFKMTILRGGGGDKYIGNQVKKKKGFLLFLQREIKIIKKKERNSLLFFFGRACLQSESQCQTRAKKRVFNLFYNNNMSRKIHYFIQVIQFLI